MYVGVHITQLLPWALSFLVMPLISFVNFVVILWSDETIFPAGSVMGRYMNMKQRGIILTRKTEELGGNQYHIVHHKFSLSRSLSSFFYIYIYIYIYIVSKFVHVSYSHIQNSKYITDTVQNKSCQTSFGMYITPPIQNFHWIVLQMKMLVDGQMKSYMYINCMHFLQRRKEAID
jgi:hypothetical protein